MKELFARGLLALAVLGGLSSSGRGAGVTVITHGFQLFGAPIPKWTERLAVAISHRSQALGHGPATIYRYKPETQAWDLWHFEREPAQAGSDGEIVLLFDWAEESNQFGAGFAEAAGEALLVALMRGATLADGRPLRLVELPLHFIGHSRGCVVNSEAVRRLGMLGITVEHVTTLDPHPAAGEFADDLAGVHAWANVHFADNYWRRDEILNIFDAYDFNGRAIPGAWDNELDEDVLGLEVDPPLPEDPGYVAEHSDVHLWYHGTADWAPLAYDGDQFVPVEFYAPGNPWRTNSGYCFSRIANEPRPSAGLAGSAYRQALPSAEHWIVNGDFAYDPSIQTSLLAGYSYHGGETGFEWDLDNQWANLNADGRTLRHNRIYVPPMTAGNAQLIFRARCMANGDTARLVVRAFATNLTNVVFTADRPWTTFSLDLSRFEDNTSTLEFGIEESGTGLIVVQLDEVRISGTPRPWPNVRLLPLARSLYAVGEQITVPWITSQTTAGAFVDLIWDNDRNPMNGSVGLARTNASSSSSSASFTVSGLNPGQYFLYARIRSADGNRVRHDFLREPVTVTPGGYSGPVIVRQPADQYVPPGATAVFSVMATGNPPLGYQWQRNGVNIAGATGSSHTTAGAGNSGAEYRVRITNSFGDVTSVGARLTVAGAAFLEWTGLAGDEQWTTRLNWNPTNVPTGQDTVLVDAGGTYIVLPSQPAFAVLNLREGTVFGDWIIRKTVVQFGGVLEGTQTLQSVYNWAGGYLGTGVLHVPTNGVLNIVGPDRKMLYQRVLENEGRVEWTGLGTVWGDRPAAVVASVINNRPRGEFNLRSDAGFHGDDASPNFSGFAITNQGLLRKNGSAGTFVVRLLTLVNEGTVEVERGSLRFGCFNVVDTSRGQFRVRPGAGLVFGGEAACTRFDGTVTGSGIVLASGELNGNLTLDGTMDWVGGAWTGEFADFNTTTILEGSALNVRGPDDKYLHNHWIENAGVIDWTGTGGLTCISAAGDIRPVLNNRSSGLVLLQSDTGFNLEGLVPGFLGVNVTNQGVFRKTGSSGASPFRTVFFRNFGLFENRSGSVHFFDGDFVQEAGLTLLSNATLAADTRLEFLGGVVIGSGTIDGSVLNEAQFSPGLLTGLLRITGDYEQGAGGTLDLEIAGSTPVTGFDRLVVGGAAALDGRLRVNRHAGYNPPPGASFSILTCTSSNGAFSQLEGLALGSGRVLRPVYALHGVTLVATNGGSPTLSAGTGAGGEFQLSWQGEPGVPYQLQASTNLVHWDPLFTTNTPTGTLLFADPAWGTLPRRFYRALVP